MSKNGFACRAFLKFAVTNVEGLVDTGIFTQTNGESYPYLIVRRDNELFDTARNFLISPICLTGVTKFEWEIVCRLIHEDLARYNIAGGFLQTRDTSVIEQHESIQKRGAYFVDKRTNFRLQTGIGVEAYINSMKRDSRQRVRKLLKEKDKFTLRKAKTETDFNLFSEMYLSNAKKFDFDSFYRFDKEDWKHLYKNDGFYLWLLSYEKKIVAGTILTNTLDGLDYTFFAYDSNIKDISRANVFFLYQQHSNQQNYLNLGGGIKENDTLARFKESMGGRAVGFKRYRFLIKNKGAEITPGHLNRLRKRWP